MQNIALHAVHPSVPCLEQPKYNFLNTTSTWFCRREGIVWNAVSKPAWGTSSCFIWLSLFHVAARLSGLRIELYRFSWSQSFEARTRTPSLQNIAFPALFLCAWCESDVCLMCAWSQTEEKKLALPDELIQNEKKKEATSLPFFGTPLQLRGFPKMLGHCHPHHT